MPGRRSRVGADWSPLVFSPRWVSGLSVQEGKSAYSMQHLSIGEVAEREGLSPEALQFYERLGLVFPVGRTKSGYRLYDVETLWRLRFYPDGAGAGIFRGRDSGAIAQPKAEVCRWVQQRVGKAHYNAPETSAAPPLGSHVHASM